MEKRDKRDDLKRPISSKSDEFLLAGSLILLDESPRIHLHSGLGRATRKECGKGYGTNSGEKFC
jgi:hypothetical protein